MVDDVNVFVPTFAFDTVAPVEVSTATIKN
jgi:hypothetical protein